MYWALALVLGYETPLLLQVVWYVLSRGIGCNTPFELELQMAPDIFNAFHIQRQHSVHIVLCQECCNEPRCGCAVVVLQNEL